MTTPTGKPNKPRNPNYSIEGIGLLLAAALVFSLVFLQFQGDFNSTTQLTMVGSRAGLVMNSGGKVTYNGVQIGKVASISETQHDGKPAAKFVLQVKPKYLPLIPANVTATVQATTVFGNKYVALNSPKQPSSQHITSHDVIELKWATTEFNTLFQTIMSIMEKVDPVKVNLTLSAAADALNGMGDKFGASLVNANDILDDVNPRMPQLRHDIQRLADLGDTYVHASPDLWDAINNVTTTAHTLNAQRRDLNSLLLAAVGAGNTGGDMVERAEPYLVRGAADLATFTGLLDNYSPELFCTIRNFADVHDTALTPVGGNGFSLEATIQLLGAENPYVYPENLPRLNVRGGPGGKAGCWQPPTHELWPAPYLVVDSGASIAPYNHFDIGSPYGDEFVWGRQVGEETINP